jgi:hypothetical protein
MKLLYLNPPDSGLGDRLLDILLLYSYSLYKCYTGIYLHWEYNNSFDQSRQCLKLEHLLSYIEFPANIHFVTKETLTELSTDTDVILFKDIVGADSIYGFINKHVPAMPLTEQQTFIDLYFSVFKLIKFKNIPNEITDVFNTQSIVTIHLRRTDKVNNVSAAHGVSIDELQLLDTKTEEYIQLRIKQGKSICIVSDDMHSKHKYIHKFKDLAKIIYFDTGDQVTQAYYDYYCLAHSDEILMSQKFSTFSITASLIGKKKQLFYIFDYGRLFHYNSIAYNFNKYPGFTQFIVNCGEPK